MDPNSNSASNDAAAAKRQALTGQWRTPPLPVFPSAHQQQQQPPIPPPTVATNISLPESTDDYAKALQEAYRRGAEAAAAMQGMPNAVSCPNFHQLPLGGGDPQFAAHPTTTTTTEPVMLVPTPLTSNAMPPPPTESTSSRSFSLPDMASYAARAQVEEEKRKKRLARNRASARLRRLRKKNLVRYRMCDDIQCRENVCTHNIYMYHTLVLGGQL